MVIAPQQVSFDSIVEFSAGGPTFVTTALSVLLVMNVFLCAFNLLPLPPLDGAAVLTLFLPGHHANKVREFEGQAMMSISAWWSRGRFSRSSPIRSLPPSPFCGSSHPYDSYY